MGKKITIGIKGYGEIVVKRPKKLTKAAFSDAMGSVAAETLLLMQVKPKKEFHPVLGFGIGNNADPPQS